MAELNIDANDVLAYMSDEVSRLTRELAIASARIKSAEAIIKHYEDNLPQNKSD